MVPRNGLGACPRRPGLYYFTHLPFPAYSEGKLLRGHCLAWLTLQFLLKVLTANLHLTFSLLWPRVNVTGYVPCELNRKPAWPTPALPGGTKGWGCAGALPAWNCRAQLQQWDLPSNFHRRRQATSPVFQYLRTFLSFSNIFRQQTFIFNQQMIVSFKIF